jgi:hypothetical protein
MGGLCGILGDATHWADGIPRPGAPPASAVAWQRRQDRRARVALANRVLRHYGLSMTDWQGRQFVLRSGTGASLIVTGLGDLWLKAGRLAGRALDPLDPALLDALDAARAE